MNNQTIPSETPPENLSYEEALAELEQIVQALESNNNSLEMALSLFERGQVLAKHCASLLDKAEISVQRLVGENLEDFQIKS